VAQTRLTIDIDSELKQQIESAAKAHHKSVHEWIENVVVEALEREQDRGWMDTDLSRLSEVDPYEWQEGELEEGDPVVFVPGKGYLVAVRPEDSGGDDIG
jgi:predicted transcriptional regulator